jgi:hypothetical protein
MPLPFVPYPQDVQPAWSERGFSMLPICNRGLDDRTSVEQAAIAVERATGPLLVISGGDDHVWSTGRMCAMIVDRMSSHGRVGDVTHLHYPQAGHMLFPYTRPSDSMMPDMKMDLGGSPAADAEAHSAAWTHVVHHLRQTRGD